MFDQQLTNSNQGEGLYHIGGDYREWPDTIRGIYEAHLIAIVLSQPPCTDLSCNGARWMAGKLKANPRVFDEAMDLVYFGRDIAEQYSTEQYSIPYAIENPVTVAQAQLYLSSIRVRWVSTRRPCASSSTNTCPRSLH